MTIIYVDSEGDNLMPMLERIWCVCVAVDDEEYVHTFLDPDSLVEFLRGLQGPLEVVMHNGLGFDLQAIRKAWGIPFTVGKEDSWAGVPCQFVDTLLLSQLLNPDRQDGHSIKAWGMRLGEYKGEWSDWSQYSEEMAAYCRQDTRVLRKVYKALLREIEDY